MDHIFLDIIDRKIPAEIIYEDDKCIAIMDKFPIQPGHFLVIPKVKSANITEASEECASHLINVARKLGKQRVLDTNYGGFKIIINTGAEAEQTIFHTHVHVIPYKK